MAFLLIVHTTHPCLDSWGDIEEEEQKMMLNDLEPYACFKIIDDLMFRLHAYLSTMFMLIGFLHF